MVRTKVAFVLRMVDDFSGNVVLGKNFRFFSKDRAISSIQKPEGLYVFLEPVNEKEEIRITHMEFHDKKILVEKSQLDSKEPILDVRMYGKKTGHFSKERDIVEGCLPYGIRNFPVQVCVKRQRPTGLLFKEIKKVGEQFHLMVYGFAKEYLIGKTFAISNQEEVETFVIQEKISMNTYRISGSFQKQYKEKIPIERVYCSVTDENGKYGIFIEKQEQVGEILFPCNCW